MRTYPTKEDKKELELLNAEKWQIETLKLNPEYVFWGNYEDYMSNDDGGWRSRVEVEDWDNFNFGLDEWNEVVNFYFEINRKNHQCTVCEGQNLNKKTLKLYNDWYDFAETGRKWMYDITEVEVEALVKEGRIRDVSGFNGYYDKETQKWYKWVKKEKIECEKPEMPLPEKVNEWAKKGFGHDAINHWICVKARAKHLGVYGHCEHCQGGYIYDEDKAKVSLQLWVLHPRKGASRGVYIKHIKKEDMPKVIEYLKEARKRNYNRFAKLDDFQL